MVADVVSGRHGKLRRIGRAPGFLDQARDCNQLDRLQHQLARKTTARAVGRLDLPKQPAVFGKLVAQQGKLMQIAPADRRDDRDRQACGPAGVAPVTTLRAELLYPRRSSRKMHLLA